MVFKPIRECKAIDGGPSASPRWSICGGERISWVDNRITVITVDLTLGGRKSTPRRR